MNEQTKQAIGLLEGTQDLLIFPKSELNSKDEHWVSMGFSQASQIKVNIREALALLKQEQPHSDSEQGIVNNGTGGPIYIKKLESDIEQLKTIVWQKQAEIDRLTAKNEKLRNGICKDGCVYLEVDKKAINHHIEVRQEQQQRIQQLEAKHREKDKTISVLMGEKNILQAELEQAKKKE